MWILPFPEEVRERFWFDAEVIPGEGYTENTGGKDEGGKAEGTGGGRALGRQESCVQLLQGTPNQGYALREGLLTNGEKARSVTVAVAAA